MAGRRDLETYAYRIRRQRLLAKAKREGWPCELCGLPIDWDAPPRTRWTFSADHVNQVRDGGDPTGPLRVSHYGCNARRGATRNGPPRRSSSSRAW